VGSRATSAQRPASPLGVPQEPFSRLAVTIASFPPEQHRQILSDCQSPADEGPDPRIAAPTLAPLLGSEAVEVFAVACLSTRHQLLTWYVPSRGTRSSTPISLPDVFVPACLTPGTTALLVVHNHPSGDPTPSPDDARLTLRLAHVRHRELYEAIGDAESRLRRPPTVPRALERIMLLDVILREPDLVWLATSEEKMTHVSAFMRGRFVARRSEQSSRREALLVVMLTRISDCPS
jgi:RadC-like JAB domain